MTKNKNGARVAAALMMAVALCLSMVGAAGAQGVDLDAAKATALAHAEIDEASATILSLERDDDDNEIEVEFLAEGVSYEYKIAADTGDIRGWKKDFLAAHLEAIDASGVVLDDEAVREIARLDAGIDGAEIMKESLKRDTDDGVLYFEVEFITETAKYEYEIGAYTGAILSIEMDFRPEATKTR